MKKEKVDCIDEKNNPLSQAILNCLIKDTHLNVSDCIFMLEYQMSFAIQPLGRFPLASAALLSRPLQDW